MNSDAPCDRDIPQAQVATVFLATLSSWQTLCLPGMLILASWSLLGLAFLTGQNRLIDHDYLLLTSHLPWLVVLLIFLFCWQVMTMAMMLPSLLSRLLLLKNTQGILWREQVMFIVGYATIWTGFALLAFVGDTFVHQLVRQWWWLYVHSQIIGALTLAFAGIYQWSTLKKRCLRHCMRQATLQNVQEISATAWRQGLQYGRWCLGSNLAFMLVMFGIGMKSLFVMVIFTLVMLYEREIFGGAWFRRMIGGMCIVAAVAWYVMPFLS
jgi:predicted metal-binding membrane protein